ncbi:MAG: hypothetical protein HFF17_04000 [Oscillospiraceae bacterium]|nr:hypothetical protein [Oscillospiraceae bacterium]
MAGDACHRTLKEVQYEAKKGNPLDVMGTCSGCCGNGDRACLYQLPPRADPALEQNVRWAIPPQYDIALPFSSGAAFVGNADGLNLRTKSGQTLSLDVPEDGTLPSGFQYGVAQTPGGYIFVNGVKADVSAPDVFFPRWPKMCWNQSCRANISEW